MSSLVSTAPLGKHARSATASPGHQHPTSLVEVMRCTCACMMMCLHRVQIKRW